MYLYLETKEWLDKTVSGLVKEEVIDLNCSKDVVIIVCDEIMKLLVNNSLVVNKYHTYGEFIAK